MKRIVLAAVLGFIACICTPEVRAQKTDSLFTEARKLAFEKQNYPAAIQLSRQAIAEEGQNVELIVFLGRLYTWNKQADSARYYFSEAQKINPQYVDAFVAYSDLEYWEKRYDTALQIAQAGLNLAPANQDLLQRKAIILYDQKEYKSALGVVDTLLRLDKGNSKARALANRIRDNASKNRIGLKYDYFYFDEQFNDPWHYLSLDYTYQSKAGAFTARMNFANCFGKQGLQYEAEAYPILSRRFYAYLNIGYSDDAGVFPQWKAAASLFANLPGAFEAEAGVRYLYFDRDAFIYTAYLGKYLGSFLVGARMYLSPADDAVSQAYSLIGRYYFGGVDDYLGLNFGTGLSPDVRQRNAQLNELYTLSSYRTELTLRKAIRTVNVFTINAAWMIQEYLPETTGNQIQIGVGYIRRF